MNIKKNDIPLCLGFLVLGIDKVELGGDFSSKGILGITGRKNYNSEELFLR